LRLLSLLLLKWIFVYPGYRISDQGKWTNGVEVPGSTADRVRWELVMMGSDEQVRWNFALELFCGRRGICSSRCLVSCKVVEVDLRGLLFVLFFLNSLQSFNID
jgi:hypothetical protein